MQPSSFDRIWGAKWSPDQFLIDLCVGWLGAVGYLFLCYRAWRVIFLVLCWTIFLFPTWVCERLVMNGFNFGAVGHICTFIYRCTKGPALLDSLMRCDVQMLSCLLYTGVPEIPRNNVILTWNLSIRKVKYICPFSCKVPAGNWGTLCPTSIQKELNRNRK